MGLKKLGFLAGVLALSVGIAAAASAGTSSKQASNALVFGAASDPVIIDGPLVSVYGLRPEGVDLAAIECHGTGTERGQQLVEVVLVRHRQDTSAFLQILPAQGGAHRGRKR